MSFMHVRFVSFLLLLVLWLIATPLMANPRARYQKSIDHFRMELEAQAKIDAKNVTADDRADIETWIADAEKLLVSRDYTSVSRLLKRIEYGIELVTTTASAAILYHRAEVQETNYHKAKEQMSAMNKELEVLKAKKRTLEKELKELQ